MPFEIVRNDITSMQVDAIVNTANPYPEIGSGTDRAIHEAAGPALLAAREAIGVIAPGDAAVTPGFHLGSRMVIHAVGPQWQGGDKDERETLRACYDRCLELALENGCSSIAFPLISSGNYGFPKPLALQTAVEAFGSFLMEQEMHIYLVVFDRESYQLSGKLFASVKSYIDENYAARKLRAEGSRHRFHMPFLAPQKAAPAPKYADEAQECAPMKECAALPMEDCSAAPDMPLSLSKLLAQTDAGFSETLLRLIDRTGKKDSEIYRKANIDRKLFSKIRNNPAYQPSKATALAFAIALELDLEQTRDFIRRAGYALTDSSKFDIIVRYFIERGNYNIHEINETLFAFDQNLLSA